MATRTYKSDLLTQPTTIEILVRTEDRRGILLNGSPYWVRKVDSDTYTVAAEGKDGYTVNSDDMGGRCDCPAGRHHRSHICKHIIACAILRQDKAALNALLVKEI